MIISPEPEEFRAALALQSKCDLRRVSLRHCHASLEGSEESRRGPFKLRLSHNSTACAINDGLLRVEVRFQIQSYDSSEPPALLFSVECAFDVDYELEDRSYQPPPESIAAFKDGNAIFNCWPYVREFVQNITDRMALIPPPPPLPFLRVVPRKKIDEAAPVPEPATVPVKRTVRRRRPASEDPAKN